jgi:hypothetical protein
LRETSPAGIRPGIGRNGKGTRISGKANEDEFAKPWRSTLSPRQQAARKSPNSWTKIRVRRLTKLAASLASPIVELIENATDDVRNKQLTFNRKEIRWATLL